MKNIYVIVARFGRTWIYQDAHESYREARNGFKKSQKFFTKSPDWPDRVLPDEIVIVKYPINRRNIIRKYIPER